jgi:hypothetical protein
VGAAWLDYDNDGDLDLFVVNYLDWSPASNKLCGSEGRRLSCPPTDYQGLPNQLYRNEGDGRFTDVSDATGIAAQIGKGMSVAVADADGDGFTDVFVANDQTRHFLFRNVAGRTFVEGGVEAGVAYTEDGVPVSGMGSDFRDLDQDGRPDLFITALSGEAFPLYINTAKGYFVPSAHLVGLGSVTVPMSGWGRGHTTSTTTGYGPVQRERPRSEASTSTCTTATGRRTPSLGSAERALPRRDGAGGSRHAALEPTGALR